MIRWITLHATEIAAVSALVATLLRVVYQIVAALVKPYPRLRASVEAVAAMSPDVLRFAGQTFRALTGRDLPLPLIDARDAELARLRKTVARQAALLAAIPPGSSIVPPATRPTAVPPPPGLTLLLAFALAGCPKVIREPEPTAPREGCPQGATTCHEGHPWVCGPGGKWSRADRRCDRLGARCCLAASPYDSGLRHACVPAAACVEDTDGGAR